MKLKVIFVFFLLLFLAQVASLTNAQIITEKTYTWKFNPDPEFSDIHSYSLTVKLTQGERNSTVEKTGDVWHIDLRVPERNYNYYNELPGAYRYAFNISYLQYFLTGEDENIKDLAEDLNYIATQEGFDNLTKANFLLSFVQESITYEDDFQTTGFYDYYQFPLETLVEGTGDCEDKSLLLASLAHDMGYDVVLFVMNITDVSTVGHVAVGVNFKHLNDSNPLVSYLRDYYIYNGKIYYYMESTANQSMSPFHPAYYVGISPKEGGYAITNVRILPYKDSWYAGFKGTGNDVREVQTNEAFPWFIVIMVLLIAVYIPFVILSFISEKKRCPNCHIEVEDSWNYCPNCGYWLRYFNPPPPPPPDEQSIK